VAKPLEEDFLLLKNAIRKAGEITLNHLGRENIKTWMKRGVEPVTEIDLEIDQYLKTTLLAARPNYGWLSEETADDEKRLKQKNVWVVDPIDGTRGFMKGQDDFSVTGALVVEGCSTIGIIFAPARDEFYAAIKGRGATLNDAPITVSNAETITGMRMQGDRDYLKSRKWTTPWPEMTIGKYKSFALRLAAVAAGKFDAAISAQPKSEWDVVAGDLIISEAGGCCVDGEGMDFTYNQKNTRLQRIVATTPGIKDEILAQLKKRAA